MLECYIFCVSINSGPAPVVPTITYTVGDRDTLTSVAARFDTTPSELTALNRLGSSFIYSGQTLLVPDKSKMRDDDSSSETSGDTEGSKDKSRKSSSNTDDIPQQEKGWFTHLSLVLFIYHFCDEENFEGQGEKWRKKVCRCLILFRISSRLALRNLASFSYKLLSINHMISESGRTHENVNKRQ